MHWHVIKRRLSTFLIFSSTLSVCFAIICQNPIACPIMIVWPWNGKLQRKALLICICYLKKFEHISDLLSLIILRQFDRFYRLLLYFDRLTKNICASIICMSLYIRHLVGSTDQADSSGFYFKIAYCSLSLLWGLRSTKK